MITNFMDLLVKHDYYCHDSNYFSKDAAQDFETWAEFYNEYHDADIDMNLIFRWDIFKEDGNHHYSMKVYIMGQRKGIFTPIRIDYVHDDNFEQIKSLLQPHFDKLQNLWQPFSQINK